MKNFIHDEVSVYVDSGVYSRELRDVGGPEKAFVYFPAGKDPQNYLGIGQTKTTPVQASDNDSDDDDDAEDDCKVIKADARGSVSVPSIVVRPKFQTGEKVAVSVSQHDNKPCLSIFREVDNHSKQAILTHYTVNGSHNVRVTRKALNVLGSGCSQVKVLPTNESILLLA